MTANIFVSEAEIRRGAAPHSRAARLRGALFFRPRPYCPLPRKSRQRPLPSARPVTNRSTGGHRRYDSCLPGEVGQPRGCS